MATLPGLVIKIGANTKDAIDGLNKVNGALGKSATSSDKFRASWSKMKPALAAVGVAMTAVTVKIGVDAVMAASDFSEAVSKSRVLFGDATDDMVKWSETAAFSMGLSKTAALDAASTFAGLGKAAGISGDELGRWSRDFSQLAGDLSSFSNTSVEDAVTALSAGLRGESEPLRRYNVLLSDAALKAEAMRQKIYDGVGPLTQQQKVLAASGVIFRDAEDAQGDFARTADGLANTLRTLNAEGANLQIILGEGIVRGMGDTLQMGGDLNRNLQLMEASMSNIGETAGSAIPLALNAFGTFIDVVKSVTAEAIWSFQKMGLAAQKAQVNVGDFLGLIGDAEAEAARKALDLAYANNEAAYKQEIMAIHIKDTTGALGDQADAAKGAERNNGKYSSSLGVISDEASAATVQLKRMKSQMDKMAANRSIAQQRIRMAQDRQNGPGKGDNLRSFGLGYADQAAQLAQDIAERGGNSEESKRKARKVLNQARDYLGSLGLGSNFTDASGAYLGTPGGLKGGTPNTRMAGKVVDESRKMGTTTIYEFNGDLVVRDAADAAEQATRASRLKGLSGGRSYGGYRR